MLLIAKSTDLDMEDVLKYSLRPFPAPLATMEGNLVKTCKSELLSIIEAESNEAYVENVDGDSALIIDAMAVRQTMKLTATTFGKLAEHLLAKIVMMANSSNSSRVDFVGDRHPQQSIKDLEREKRSDGETYLTKIYGTQQRVPRQLKKFLSAARNKEELLKFLFEEWKRCCPQVLNGVEVLITHENECHRLYAMGNNTICSIVNSLTCNHEEANTRMICHAKDASLTHSKVVIKSPDTDVFFIALNAAIDINAQIYFETGVQTKRRIISLDKVKEDFSPPWCSALLGFHAFTGKTICQIILVRPVVQK